MTVSVGGRKVVSTNNTKLVFPLIKSYWALNTDVSESQMSTHRVNESVTEPSYDLCYL